MKSRPEKTSKMNSRERVLAVLQHQEPDRIPHFEWVHDKGLINVLTKGGNYFDLIELLDIDGVMAGPAYRRESLDGNMVQDEWGSVRIIAQDNYAMVVEDRVPIKSEADFESWQTPDPYDPFRFEPLRQTVTRFGGERAIIFQARDVWSPVRDYMGYERALVNMLDQPDLVEAVVSKCVDHYIPVIQRAAELGADIVFTGDDIADSKGPLFSPRLWQKLLLPHYRRLVDAIHDAGLFHWKHSDGNMYPFLDSIIAAGTDGIDPIDPMGGMQLSVVKEKYGDQVAIKGNVDQTELLSAGPSDQVVAAVKACLFGAGKGGGYVCSSSNSIHSGVDPELYRIMIEAIHTYGHYPLDMDMIAP
jgi:uroporphyrinogen decarboxylase